MNGVGIFWHFLIVWSAGFWLFASGRVLYYAAQPWDGPCKLYRRLSNEAFLSTAFGFAIVSAGHLMFGTSRILQWAANSYPKGPSIGVFTLIGISSLTLVAGEWWLCRVQFRKDKPLWRLYNGGIIAILGFGFFSTLVVGIN